MLNNDRSEEKSLTFVLFLRQRKCHFTQALSYQKTLKWSNNFQTRASVGGGNGNFPHLEVGTKNQKFLENLMLAKKFRLIHLIVAMTVYLQLWHKHRNCTRAKFTSLPVQVSGSDKIAVRSCPILCLQRHFANLASGLFYWWSLLRNNKHGNKSLNVRFKLR